jgi:iron complex transport system permease protein
MKHKWAWPMLVPLLALTALVSLCLGKYPLTLREVTGFLWYHLTGWGTVAAERRPILESVVLDIRLPRILTAALIGAALSVSGTAYQAIFLNPLVSPGILGVLAGASFGGALGLVFMKSWLAVQVSTFLGGIAAVGFALLVARIYRGGQTVLLVLGGIISSALFTALVSVVKYLADPYNQLPVITSWLMGNMAMADRAATARVGLPILAGIAMIGLLARQLDVLSLGDEEARALGVRVDLVRYLVIIFATLVSTLTVLLAGMIGWVGLIIPHITRMLVGPGNRILVPSAALVGAIYMVVVDDLSRLLFHFELPIGIATSLLGIPFFLLVLRNARRGWQ